MAEENQQQDAQSGLPNGDTFWAGRVSSLEETNNLLERALEAASPNAVFQEPVVMGDTAVITCCELNVGLGVGYGGGSDAKGGGGGGGGGGGSMGRPVAAITIRPDGVKVEPVVDYTKLGIAILTTFGAMFVMRRKIFGG